MCIWEYVKPFFLNGGLIGKCPRGWWGAGVFSGTVQRSQKDSAIPELSTVSERFSGPTIPPANGLTIIPGNRCTLIPTNGTNKTSLNRLTNLCIFVSGLTNKVLFWNCPSPFTYYRNRCPSTFFPGTVKIIPGWLTLFWDGPACGFSSNMGKPFEIMEKNELFCIHKPLKCNELQNQLNYFHFSYCIYMNMRSPCKHNQWRKPP